MRAGGVSRDTFYRYKSAVEDGGAEAFFERTRRKPNLANRVLRHRMWADGTEFRSEKVEATA